MNYIVRTRLDLDNRLYEPGVVVEIDEEVAAPLLAGGVVERAPEGAAPTKGKKK
jgi:hypothetical protein